MSGVESVPVEAVEAGLEAWGVACEVDLSESDTEIVDHWRDCTRQILTAALPVLREQIAAEVLGPVRAAIAATSNVDYAPEQGWQCADHGVVECAQGECADLSYPSPREHPILFDFEVWADGVHASILRPYDESDDPEREIPDEAFHAYSISMWPLCDALDSIAALSAPVQAAEDES